ncbi:MAG TPA: glycerophosphodiester phosphodiesterase family protein [Pyrinomonadaceae bacterium]|nr:glycerophosphodiester phosphodiesterase family protein [Pyrinomonadaceae bacterium]
MIERPLIIGHRGASALAPENTLAAFTRALADGADGFEFDVRLASNQLPVVIHDATLTRTAGINTKISEASGEDLSRAGVGAWFNRKFPHLARPEYESETLPTLRDVLALFSDTRALLYLEMKGEGPRWDDLAGSVVELIRRFAFTDRTVVVECFHLPALAEIKRLDAGIRTAALFEPSIKRPLSSLRIDARIEQARAVGSDEVAIHHRLVSARAVAKATQLGMSCVVWTVDDPRWVHRATALGLKALITNNPRVMRPAPA